MPQAEVFISWTRASASSESQVRSLESALRRRGVGVWLDATAISPFESIPEKIRQGLMGARVLVAWYSREYPARRACREELTLALLAAERGGERPSRVLVVNPEDGIDHVIEPKLLEQRIAGPADIADMDRLAELIAGRVEAVGGSFELLPGAAPAHWFGGRGWQDGSPRFVGRLGTMWMIHDRLHRSTGLVGPGKPGRGIAVVSGFGGVGKSLLASEYAHLFGSLYPGGVVWLSALGHDTTDRMPSAEQARATADAQLTGVAGWLKLDVSGLSPDEVRERIKTEITDRGQPILWIVDDLPTGLSGADLDRWRCPSPVTFELITTRDRAHSLLDTIDLDVLDPADALALLTQGRGVGAEELEQAELLADELGYHPLACDVAGLYVASRTSFASYRGLLAGSLHEFDELAAELADQLPGDHARQITATLATSLRELGPEAWKLLRVSAQLAPTAIPRPLVTVAFVGVLAVDNFMQSADGPLGRRRGLKSFLGRRGHQRPAPISPDGRILAEVAPSRAEVEHAVDRAIGDSHRDGLWRYDPATGTISVHVLVRQAALIRDPHPELAESARSASVAAAIGLLAQGRSIQGQDELVLTAEHARHLTSPPARTTAASAGPGQTLDANWPDELTVVLLDQLGGYDQAGGRYDTAYEAFLRVYEWRARTYGANHSSTVNSRNNLAAAARHAGRPEEAISLLEPIQAGPEQVQGDEELRYLGNLASHYQAARQFDKALPLYQRVLDEEEKIRAR